MPVGTWAASWGCNTGLIAGNARRPPKRAEYGALTMGGDQPVKGSLYGWTSVRDERFRVRLFIVLLFPVRRSIAV